MDDRAVLGDIREILWITLGIRKEPLTSANAGRMLSTAGRNGRSETELARRRTSRRAPPEPGDGTTRSGTISEAVTFGKRRTGSVEGVKAGDGADGLIKGVKAGDQLEDRPEGSNPRASPEGIVPVGQPRGAARPRSGQLLGAPVHLVAGDLGASPTPGGGGLVLV